MPHPASPIQDPYLGRQSLYRFDVLISAAMALNTTVAGWTHGKELTSLQRAACQIIPNGFSIALSIRELVRGGYLFSAEILLRPLVERVAVISYLMTKDSSAIHLWEEGWPHKTRPPLKTMLDAVSEYDEIPADWDVRQDAKEMIDRFNSVIHADPAGLDTNIGTTTTGVVGYLSGANVSDPVRCDIICDRATFYMSLLMKKAVENFPGISAAPELLH